MTAGEDVSWTVEVVSGDAAGWKVKGFLKVNRHHDKETNLAPR
jgi:hypothetical protein